YKVQFLYSKCHFFFFQAEDGIRGRTVTGVQTCALPISLPVPTTRSVCEYATLDTWLGSVGVLLPQPVVVSNNAAEKIGNRSFMRSEERRVGKECRDGRWT